MYSELLRQPIPEKLLSTLRASKRWKTDERGLMRNCGKRPEADAIPGSIWSDQKYAA
jgi:hypothetical protein